MTGYGKAACRFGDLQVNVELRCLNGKGLDLNLKMPAVFRGREQEIRALLSSALERGKAELVISINGQNNTGAFALNKALMERYYRELKDFAEAMGEPASEELIPAILRLPEIVQQDQQALDDTGWQSLEQAIGEALTQCDRYRVSEGSTLAGDFALRIQHIARLLEALRPLDTGRREAVRDRLMASLEKLQLGEALDQNRFEQELIYYLEKLDITEELVRLENHIAYFSDCLEDESSGGKKLGFIAQEIGREINTIGSKANDAAIQKIVVQMKDELEKIKEQLMNIL